MTVDIIFDSDLDASFTDMLTEPTNFAFNSNLNVKTRDQLIVSDPTTMPVLPTSVRTFGTWITRTRLPGSHRTAEDPSLPWRPGNVNQMNQGI